MSKRDAGIKQVIGIKMQILEDFGICDKKDKTMRERLAKVIADNPNKDPREVLDYYCRPMIQNVINSWS